MTLSSYSNTDRIVAFFVTILYYPLSSLLIACDNPNAISVLLCFPLFLVISVLKTDLMSLPMQVSIPTLLKLLSWYEHSGYLYSFFIGFLFVIYLLFFICGTMMLIGFLTVVLSFFAIKSVCLLTRSFLVNFTFIFYRLKDFKKLILFFEVISFSVSVFDLIFGLNIYPLNIIIMSVSSLAFIDQIKTKNVPLIKKFFISLIREINPKFNKLINDLYLSGDSWSDFTCNYFQNCPYNYYSEEFCFFSKFKECGSKVIVQNELKGAYFIGNGVVNLDISYDSIILSISYKNRGEKTVKLTNSDSVRTKLSLLLEYWSNNPNLGVVKGNPEYFHNKIFGFKILHCVSFDELKHFLESEDYSINFVDVCLSRFFVLGSDDSDFTADKMEINPTCMEKLKEFATAFFPNYNRETVSNAMCLLLRSKVVLFKPICFKNSEFKIFVSDLNYILNSMLKNSLTAIITDKKICRNPKRVEQAKKFYNPNTSYINRCESKKPSILCQSILTKITDNTEFSFYNNKFLENKINSFVFNESRLKSLQKKDNRVLFSNRREEKQNKLEIKIKNETDTNDEQSFSFDRFFDKIKSKVNKLTVSQPYCFKNELGRVKEELDSKYANIEKIKSGEIKTTLKSDPKITTINSEIDKSKKILERFKKEELERSLKCDSVDTVGTSKKMKWKKTKAPNISDTISALSDKVSKLEQDKIKIEKEVYGSDIDQVLLKAEKEEIESLIAKEAKTKKAIRANNLKIKEGMFFYVNYKSLKSQGAKLHASRSNEITLSNMFDKLGEEDDLEDVIDLGERYKKIVEDVESAVARDNESQMDPLNRESKEKSESSVRIIKAFCLSDLSHGPIIEKHGGTEIRIQPNSKEQLFNQFKKKLLNRSNNKVGKLLKKYTIRELFEENNKIKLNIVSKRHNVETSLVKNQVNESSMQGWKLNKKCPKITSSLKKEWLPKVNYKSEENKHMIFISRFEKEIIGTEYPAFYAFKKSNDF